MSGGGMQAGQPCIQSTGSTPPINLSLHALHKYHSFVFIHILQEQILQEQKKSTDQKRDQETLF